MKQLVLLLFCSLLFLLNSCKDNGNKPNDFKNFSIDSLNVNEIAVIEKEVSYTRTIEVPDSYDKSIRISQLVDTCYFIPLENGNNNLIGQIDEIKVTDNRIFILDSQIAKSVFAFNKDGTYIGKIGESGEGPGEYLWPQDFDIDIKNKEVLIFNGNMSTLLRYDYDGNFLGQIRLNIRCLAFSIMDNGNIALYSGFYPNEHLGFFRQKLVYIINRKGDFVSGGFEMNDDFNNIDRALFNNALVKNNNLLSFSPKLSDTIFELNEDKITSQYQIKFSGSGREKEIYKDISYKEFKERSGDYPFFLGLHFQTKDYLYLKYGIGRKVINVYYNKKQDKMKSAHGFKIDDIRFILSSGVLPIGTHNEYFIGYSTPSELMRKKQTLLADQEILNQLKDQPAINLLMDVKEGDNPILIFYKFKKTLNE